METPRLWAVTAGRWELLPGTGALQVGGWDKAAGAGAEEWGERGVRSALPHHEKCPGQLGVAQERGSDRDRDPQTGNSRTLELTEGQVGEGHQTCARAPGQGLAHTEKPNGTHRSPRWLCLCLSLMREFSRHILILDEGKSLPALLLGGAQ